MAGKRGHPCGSYSSYCFLRVQCVSVEYLGGGPQEGKEVAEWPERSVGIAFLDQDCGSHIIRIKYRGQWLRYRP